MRAPLKAADRARAVPVFRAARGTAGRAQPVVVPSRAARGTVGGESPVAVAPRANRGLALWLPAPLGLAAWATAPGLVCRRGPRHQAGTRRTSRRGVRGDRGSVSLWLVIFTFVAFTLLVLVVDGGQTMNAKSRAADIAEQAARAAADDLNVTDLRSGTITLNGGGGNGTGSACDLTSGPAAHLVHDYVVGERGVSATLTGCKPTVTDVDGTPSLTVTATVQLSMRPALPVPPFNTISASAQETAYLACGSADEREAC